MIQKRPSFLFIQSEHENIGLEYLSACLKKAGFIVNLLFIPKPFDNTSIHISVKKNPENQQISKTIKKLHPDVVCFSPFTPEYLWCTQKAKFIKSHFKNIFTLFGGVHVNSVPEYVIKDKSVDGLIVGEADYSLIEFAKNFFTEKLYSTPSLWIKKHRQVIKNPLLPLPLELDRLPFPDKQIFYEQIPTPLRDYSYVVMGSRGCPFSCAYCSNNVYKKLYFGQKRLRFRSPENIIEELKLAKTLYPFKIVEFMDDVLTIDETRLLALLKLYRRHVKLPFTCFLHPQLVTPKSIHFLKKSGCFWLKIGVQSANEQYRRNFLNRNELNADIIRVSELCHQYKLDFSFDHIFNLPGETEEHLVEAVKLYNLCRPTIINFGSLIYLPKTDIINFGLKYKNISKNDVVKINYGLDPVSHLNNSERFSFQYAGQKTVNVSGFSLLFTFINIFPRSLVDLSLKLKLYRLNVPNSVLIFFKVISKFISGQGFLYIGVLKSVLYYLFFNSH
jgi:anaerobic magnesium-protoporphyrin IX monomethyl ester cyclase